MEPHLPPQPPPDAPAPPPGPEAIRSRRWMKRILWVGGIAVAIPAIIGLLTWLVIRQGDEADLIEAANNLKQVGTALHEFETRYGKFPDDSTIPPVQAQDHTKLIFGTTSSNHYFRQLIATTANHEAIFFAHILPRHFYPNDLIGPDALKKDECSFSYIPGLSSSDDPKTPVAMAPLLPSTLKFDPKPFGRKAVILFVDGTVKTFPIEKNGDVIVNGMNLFDSRQPYWRGKVPSIKWPE